MAKIPHSTNTNSYKSLAQNDVWSDQMGWAMVIRAECETTDGENQSGEEHNMLLNTKGGETAEKRERGSKFKGNKIAWKQEKGTKVLY